jgi:hypothetical protein
MLDKVKNILQRAKEYNIRIEESDKLDMEFSAIIYETEDTFEKLIIKEYIKTQEKYIQREINLLKLGI